MQQLDKWDYRFMEMAKLVSTWSKDPRCKVGAVIVKNRKILSTGYNGFPAGLSDDLSLYLDRRYKLEHVVHAEANAIFNSPIQPKGATLYCTFAPCLNCALAIIQSKIVRVVSPEIIEGSWQSNQLEAQYCMNHANVETAYIREPEYMI